MTMHAAAVVAVERLRHERRALVVLPRDVLHDVLEPHQLIGHRRERRELHPDLALPRARDLVMPDLDLDAALDERRHDRLTEIAELIRGRNGEVAFLVTDLVAEVRQRVARSELVRLAAVPRRL